MPDRKLILTGSDKSHHKEEPPTHNPTGGSVVKNPPASSGETGDVGQKDPLKKGMATHSSILAWKILWTEEPGRLSMGSQGVRHN